MKSAGKARNNGLYRHIRTSKEIIRNLLNDYVKYSNMIKGTGVCLSLEGYLLFNCSTFSVSSFTAVVSVRANASLE